MKIMMLIPCLMLSNNRKANHKAMDYAQKYYAVDEFVVNDSEFLEDDYRDGFTYIGHHKERLGFVKTRNQLLEYFYNSDADYAFWMDANGKVSKTTLNDVDTIFRAIHEDKFNLDVVFSTLGIQVSGHRMTAKKLPDYFDNTYLVKFDNGYDWMHGLIMKNFKKYYGTELYIDERCDSRKGLPEDVYFARLLRKVYDHRLAATVIVSKPSNKTSTWVADQKGYKYPKVDYDLVDSYVNAYLKDKKHIIRPKTQNTVILKRTEDFKSYLTPYVPKVKKFSERLLSKSTGGTDGNKS